MLDNNGYLPKGVHEVDIDVVQELFGSSNERRKYLFQRFERAAQNLFSAGAVWIVLGGSFVTDNENPRDVDGVWEPGDKINMDTLDEVFFLGSTEAMKEKYSIDFYMDDCESASMVNFFRSTRDGRSVGVLLIKNPDL